MRSDLFPSKKENLGVVYGIVVISVALEIFLEERYDERRGKNVSFRSV